MGFITRASAKHPRPQPDGLFRHLAFCLAFCIFLPSSVLADGFTISNVNARLKENVYLLSASIDFQPTKEVLEALKNGVPITVYLEIEIQRKRKWWLDEDIATLEQRYQLQYHALSHQYLLSNLNSGGFNSYRSLKSALYALGRLRDLPLLDKQLIKPEQRYEVLLHAELEIEALPSPLRPLAYITPAWRLSSDWFTWLLKP